MSKYDLEIQSRHIFADDKRASIAELYEAIGHVELSDDIESNRGFDFTFYSDSQRHKATVAFDEDESIRCDVKGTEIAGTRTSDTVFTRTSGVWVTNALVGYRVWAYVAGAEESGAWFNVLSNTTTAITLTSGSVLTTGCTRIKLQARPAIRHNVKLELQTEFFGSFFKYKFIKTMPTDGNFKWLGIDLFCVRTNLEPEFVAGSGAVEPGWE
jgi:hypothetical protein